MKSTRVSKLCKISMETQHFLFEIHKLVVYPLDFSEDL